MTFSIPATIRGLVAPDHSLSCATGLWRGGLAELKRRGGGRSESGAFLLGKSVHGRRRVLRFVFYDDLDPHCLDTGIVVLSGHSYGPLWRLCRETGMDVVADVHTHPASARQSAADRAHPMIAIAGHVALIVPDYARKPSRARDLGIYQYQGDHRWVDHSGERSSHFFYIGLLG